MKMNATTESMKRLKINPTIHIPNRNTGGMKIDCIKDHIHTIEEGVEPRQGSLLNLMTICIIEAEAVQDSIEVEATGMVNMATMLVEMNSGMLGEGITMNNIMRKNSKSLVLGNHRSLKIPKWLKNQKKARKRRRKRKKKVLMIMIKLCSTEELEAEVDLLRSRPEE